MYKGYKRGLWGCKRVNNKSILQEHLTFKLYTCLWNWLSVGVCHSSLLFWSITSKTGCAPLVYSIVHTYLWLEVNLVCCLLELPDFSDDVRNLKTKQSTIRTWMVIFFLLNSHTYPSLTDSLPFSSWRSWPSCLRCSWVFLPQWKPGQWDTFPNRARREDHSWWENNRHRVLVRQVGFVDLLQNFVLELNSLLQSFSQIFEPPFWWDQLLQLVNQCLCLPTWWQTEEKVFKDTINDYNRKQKLADKTFGHTHLLGNLEPSLLKAEDRAAVKGGGDLEHSVVVVETATDVSHSDPFLYDHYPCDHILTAQDLCGNKVAYLSEDREKRMV